MTQAEFARITGLGTATLVRWENGSMNHTRANDRYVRLLQNPDVMRQLRGIAEPAARRASSSNASDCRWRVRTETDALRREQSAFVLRRAA